MQRPPAKSTPHRRVHPRARGRRAFFDASIRQHKRRLGWQSPLPQQVPLSLRRLNTPGASGHGHHVEPAQGSTVVEERVNRFDWTAGRRLA
jgi:hypothetical protein